MGRIKTLAIGAAIAATAALAFGAGSAAAQSCGQAVIQDWYVDGTIDGKYSPRCYREALGRVTDQDRIYSDLPEQLDRGLRAALAQRGTLGTKKTVTQPAPRQTASSGSRKASGPVQRVLGELGPDRADSIPIPLMILAGVAFLLIAAGAFSALFRRLHGRRDRP
jgi:hypothetical protein